jgi:hypothetical protein
LKPRTLVHRPILLARTLIVFSAILQLWACNKVNRDSQASMLALVASRLPDCIATSTESRWQEVTVGTLATMQLPQDARPVTAPVGHWVWRLADYGGFGYSLRSRDSSSIQGIISDSSAGQHGWCVDRTDSHAFLARIVVGHMYASFGRHFEARWPLSDGGELVLSGMTDTTAGNVLLQIARTVRVHGS